MSRILSKGTILPFETDHVPWDEVANVKDYDYYFVNLSGLDEFARSAIRNGDGKTLKECSDLSGINYPSRSDLLRFLHSGGVIFATLPKQSSVTLGRSVSGVVHHSYLSWMPFEHKAVFEEGNSIDEESISSDWKWYFSGREFVWHLHFPIENMRTISSNTAIGRKSILSNRFDRAIAQKITVTRPNSSNSAIGSIYLVPQLDSWNYRDLASNFLKRTDADSDFEEGVEESPGWVSSYSLPGESELKSEIKEIEDTISDLNDELEAVSSELEKVQKYHRLLYGNEGELEELVPGVFDELGLDVDGETPHGPDGKIFLDDKVLLLEITGTTSGIKRKKCHQLDQWVGEYQYNNPDVDCSGLLVVNPFRRTDPDERSGYLSPDVENYMERRGHQILLTSDLHRLFEGCRSSSVSEEDVVRLLSSDSIVLDVDSVL